jgi:hypothetical protein
MSREDLKAELEQLALRKEFASGIRLKVSEKGLECRSIYRAVSATVVYIKLRENAGVHKLNFAPTLAAVLLLACTPTNAARRLGGSAHDGTWSVAIYTVRGACGSVRVAVRIVGGRVYSEDQSYRARGGVGKNGVVRVAVSGFGRSAAGSGRLSGNSGSGSWRSSRGECSGSWSGSRRAGY